MNDGKNIDDGGPAYPLVSWRAPDGVSLGYAADGISRREWFAGQALASYLANPEGWRAKPDIIARDCYAIADAFIARGKVERHG